MKLQTNNGYFYEIDEEDAEIVGLYNWYGWKSRRRNSNGEIKFHSAYIVANHYHDNTNTRIFMHRVIMNVPNGIEIDHVNGDGLDNRKINLRLCSRGQNNKNVSKRIDNRSGFKGVKWHKQFKKWHARIKNNGKRYSLGLYETKTEAAIAYNKAASTLHGDFARLNTI
jgi:hypothetical protein